MAALRLSPPAAASACRLRASRGAALRAPARAGSRCTPRAAAAADDAVQLGTARLPANTNVEAFSASMFQWCAGLTLQGSNLPFALSQRVDRLPTGFALALLQRDAAGALAPICRITAEVEQVDGASIFVVAGAPAAKLEACVDVPVIMGAMPSAIRRAVITAQAA